MFRVKPGYSVSCRPYAFFSDTVIKAAFPMGVLASVDKQNSGPLLAHFILYKFAGVD